MDEPEKYKCRVCGLQNEDMPWGADNSTPSFDICVCCGNEFGFDDDTYAAVLEYREKWISKGAKWNDEKFRPDDWDLQEQLARIPKAYL